MKTFEKTSGGKIVVYTYLETFGVWIVDSYTLTRKFLSTEFQFGGRSND